MAASEAEIFTLHRYFIWENEMRVHFEDLLKTNPSKDVINGQGRMYMSLWYGTLCVLAEGWRDLDLHDPRIDHLINLPAPPGAAKGTYYELLYRFRNATFHYQKDYDSQKFAEFIEQPTTVAWVRSLHIEFARWFYAWLAKTKV